MKHIYTSIDIGSDTVKVVVCELFNNKLNLLAASSVKSKGIKRGLITDVTDATISIKKAISEIENMIGIKVKRVITSIPNYFSDYSFISGDVKVIDERGTITTKDVSKAISKAIANKITPSKEVVTILPIDFNLDGRNGIVMPIGLTARNLGIRGIMVTTPLKNIYSVVTLLENIGLEVIDISLNCIGDIYMFKNKEIENKIGAIINIGAETTSVSLYNKGIPIKNSILNIGGRNIDSDLSYMFKINQLEAKKIKEKFAIAHTRNANPSDAYEVTSAYGEKTKISQFAVSEIVQARLEEILNLAKKEINILTNREIQYIIVTGGTSNMKSINLVIDEIFHKNANIGNVKIIGLRNNKFASAVGNIVYYINMMKLRDKDSTMMNEDEIVNISSRKNDTSGDTMLGNVFNYFFGE